MLADLKAARSLNDRYDQPRLAEDHAVTLTVDGEVLSFAPASYRARKDGRKTSEFVGVYVTPDEVARVVGATKVEFGVEPVRAPLTSAQLLALKTVSERIAAVTP